MPLLGLAPLFASFISAVFAFFATYFAKKLAAGATLVVVFLSVTTVFYLAIQALIAGVASGITNPYLLQYFYVIKPDNLQTCITAIFAAEYASFLYRYQLMFIRTLVAV